MLTSTRRLQRNIDIYFMNNCLICAFSFLKICFQIYQVIVDNLFWLFYRKWLYFWRSDYREGDVDPNWTSIFSPAKATDGRKPSTILHSTSNWSHTHIQVLKVFSHFTLCLTVNDKSNRNRTTNISYFRMRNRQV